MSRDLSTYQDKYLEQPYEHVQKRVRKRHLIDWLERESLVSGKILEVGCGDDSIVNQLGGFSLFEIVEPASKFFEITEQHVDVHPEKENIRLSNCLLEDFKNEAGVSFDVIIVSCLLHEIQDQSSFLRTIASLMTENTLLYIDVPNANSFHRVLAYELGLIKDVFQKSESQKRFQQNDFFSVESLRAMLVAHDFEVIDMATMIFKPFTHSQMQSLIDKELFSEEFLEGLSGMDKYVPDLGSEIFAVAKL